MQNIHLHRNYRGNAYQHIIGQCLRNKWQKVFTHETTLRHLVDKTFDISDKREIQEELSDRLPPDCSSTSKDRHHSFHLRKRVINDDTIQIKLRKIKCQDGPS